MVSTVIGAVPAAIPEPFLRAQSVPGKFFLMFFAIFFFALVFGLVLFLASLFKGKNGERVQGALFVGPAVVLLAVGLMYPAILTIIQSLRGRSGEAAHAWTTTWRCSPSPNCCSCCATRPCG